MTLRAVGRHAILSFLASNFAPNNLKADVVVFGVILPAHE